MELLIDFPGGSRVDAHFGSFTVQTDQPPAASAPSPFDVFLSSIGTCAGIYVPGFCHAGISPATRPSHRRDTDRRTDDPEPVWRHGGKDRPRDQTAGGLSGEISRGSDPFGAIMRGQKTSGASAENRDYNNDELSLRHKAPTSFNKQLKLRIRKTLGPPVQASRRVK
jgi:hypothetical protein